MTGDNAAPMDSKRKNLQSDNLDAILRGVSRSFYLSIRLLPAPLRRPIGLAYLLARATDTIADTVDLPVGARQLFLAELARAVDQGAMGNALMPMSASFAALQQDEYERRLIQSLPSCFRALEVVQDCDRDDIKTVLRHITHGQTLDVQRFGQPGVCNALASADELDEYTYLVAGSVGEFWTDLCTRHLPAFATLPTARMRELGRDYGCGLQLVNILRDLAPDLAAGRCYLPAEDLAAHGLSCHQAATQPQRLAPVWRLWHARAEALLVRGMQYADAVNSRRVRAATALPALLGARTLALLHEAGPLVFTARVKMPRGEVRSACLRIALTLAARGPLRAQFERLGKKSAHGGWDNTGQ